LRFAALSVSAQLIPVIMMTDAIDLGFLDEQSVDEPVVSGSMAKL